MLSNSAQANCCVGSSGVIKPTIIRPIQHWFEAWEGYKLVLRRKRTFPWEACARHRSLRQPWSLCLPVFVCERYRCAVERARVSPVATVSNWRRRWWRKGDTRFLHSRARARWVRPYVLSRTYRHPLFDWRDPVVTAVCLLLPSG